MLYIYIYIGILLVFVDLGKDMHFIKNRCTNDPKSINNHAQIDRKSNQESLNWKLETEAGNWRPKAQKLESRSQKLEAGSWKMVSWNQYPVVDLPVSTAGGGSCQKARGTQRSNILEI